VDNDGDEEEEGEGEEEEVEGPMVVVEEVESEKLSQHG
jgi:hypothetical protein